MRIVGLAGVLVTAGLAPTDDAVMAAPLSSRTRPIGIFQLGTAWGSASRYDRYGYLVVGRSAASSAVRQPGLALVYHSGTGVNVKWNTGVPYTVARANGWLLADPSGALLTNNAYPDNYIGDVGNAAYQAEWARRVSHYLASVRADGVFIDDVIADISTMSGVFPAKYPSQTAWENAMAAFIASVGPALKSRGFYVLVNAHKWVAGNAGSDDGSVEAQWWQRLGASVSGLHTESWVQDPTNTARLRALGPEWWNHWDGWQRLVRVAQSTGADFFGYTEGSITNTRAMRYGKASFLLDWDGGGGGFIYLSSDRRDPWRPAWTTDIGRPVGAKRAITGGVWMRRFQRGTIVVNPTLTAVTVTIDGIARSIGATDALIITG
jgi:hypothetical protein